MPADPRLLAHPAVLRAAEARARTRYFTEARVGYGDALLAVAAWEEHEHREFRIAVEAALLADPSGEASRDWMARRIASAIGWDHWRVSRAGEGSEPEEWRALMDACNVPERERRLASAAALTLAFLAVVR